jgi:hypothetical protein
MAAEAGDRTLLEDWQARRDCLTADAGPIPQYAALQLQVLGYLLERYRHSAEAARPARFVPRCDLAVHPRAIVVHHHLGEGVLGGVKTRHEAAARVTGILGRLTAQPAAPSGVPPLDDGPWPGEPQYVASAAWGKALRAIARGRDAHELIEEAIRSHAVAPERALRYLYRCLLDVGVTDALSLELLAGCRNSNAVGYAVLAWRRRIEAGCEEDLRREFEQFFSRPAVRQLAAERLRVELAADDPRVRLAAIELLGTIGTLADVGLFSDLLALPSLADEDPGERPALLRAMQKMAGAS